MFRRGRDRRPTAAEALRPLLYGDVAPEQWRSPSGEPATAEPWRSFEQALAYMRAGDMARACGEWQRVTTMDGVGSRNVLQAWRFLRDAGIRPSAEVSADVIGVVAEVAVAGGHDLLAAYRDGSVRYLNYSGKVLVVEPDATTAQLADAVRRWLQVAQALAQVVDVWDQPQLPPLPSGDSRIMMLTPLGMRFGQGPDGALRQDRAADAFLTAATEVLTTVMALVPKP
jgi:hypothetical protein